jgi:hypothetical protein
MPRVPRSVRLSVPRSLALRSTACALSGSNPHVRQKPSSADATWPLLEHSAVTIADHALYRRSDLAAAPPLLATGRRQQDRRYSIRSVGHF